MQQWAGYLANPENLPNETVHALVEVPSDHHHNRSLWHA